jgi:hypothetical protein
MIITPCIDVSKLAVIGKAAVVKATEVPDRFFPQVCPIVRQIDRHKTDR